jgi:hypothetical protein
MIATAEKQKIKLGKTRAHQRYTLSDGTRVPGVTTVLGIINKPALLKWAWQCGVDGIDYTKARDGAADVGTVAHRLIECHLKGEVLDTSEVAPADLALAESAFIKFLDWWDKGGYELVCCEVQLVHEIQRYGGTLDIVARRPDGALCLVDIKTSKAIYPEMWRQVAAYGALYEFCRGAKPDAYAICRIGRSDKDADWEVQERGDVGRQYAAFMAILRAYQAIKAEME